MLIEKLAITELFARVYKYVGINIFEKNAVLLKLYKELFNLQPLLTLEN